jgi:hypothetical protein
VSSLRPWVVAEADWVAVGGLNLLAVCGPEPAVDVLWEQIFAIFATCDGSRSIRIRISIFKPSRLTVEIAQASRSPDVWNIIFLDQLEDEVVLFLCLNRDSVHAVLAADVTCFQPVDALC